MSVYTTEFSFEHANDPKRNEERMEGIATGENPADRLVRAEGA
jgi:hypothetical protein